MAKGNGKHSVRDYILIALILGVITFIEFYIVEYPVPWLSTFWVMFWLVTLSLAKFFMVIWWFMHLKDDDKRYTGFFTSGMVIAMGTFIAFTVLMIAPASFSYVSSNVAPQGRFVFGDKPGDYQLPGFSEELRASIDTDGYSRPMEALLATARPKAGAFRVEAPRASDPDARLLAQAEVEERETEEAHEEAEVDEPVAAEVPSRDWDVDLGISAYAANCASCHQGNGQGIPGAFPPVRDHLGELLARDSGRAYLAHVLLYGLQGQIEVEGNTYAGVMPDWQQLDDDELAAIANHLAFDFAAATTPSDFEPYDADEFASYRGQGLGPGDVLAERQDLLTTPPSDEPDTEDAPEADPADEGPEFDAARGAAVFGANCVSCHQAEGQGIPGAFPPLRANVVAAAESAEGRAYLIDVLLSGLQGPIQVDGVGYAGVMPGWRHLSDEDIAQVLNHIVFTFEPAPASGTEAFDAEAVAEHREGTPSPQELNAVRQELGLP